MESGQEGGVQLMRAADRFRRDLLMVIAKTPQAGSNPGEQFYGTDREQQHHPAFKYRDLDELAWS